MSASGYTAWSVTAGEMPTTAYWNILGSNDASFNTGNGFNDGAIIGRHLSTASVEPAALDWLNFGEQFMQVASNYSAAVVSSFVPQDIPSSTVTVTIPTGFSVELIFGGSYLSGSNTEHDLVLATSSGTSLISITNTYTAGAGTGIGCSQLYVYTPVSAGSYSFKLQASGNPGNFDFRNLYIKTRVFQIA